MKAAVGVLLTLLAIGGAFYAGATTSLPASAEVGPVATAAPTALPRLAFEDATGDARDHTVTRLSYGPGCRLGCVGVPAAVAHAAGTEAPFLDILEAAFERDEGDVFVLSLAVASLTEGFPELETPGVNRIAEYQVCWEPSREHAVRCAVLTAATEHGEASTLGTFHVFSEDCNEWGECAFAVPAEVRYGEPGVVHLTVPKSYAAYDGAPIVLSTLAARSGWYSANEVAPLWHAAWSVRANGEHHHAHQGLLEAEDRADVLGPVDVGLALPPGDGSWTPAEGPVLEAAHGAVWGGGGPHDRDALDLLALDLWEEGDDLVARYTVRGLDGGLPAHSLHYLTLVGRWGSLVHEFGVLQESGGDAYGYAGRCVAFECHDAHVEKVPMEVEAGTPGHVTIRVPLRVLGDPAPGEATDFLWAVTMYSEANVYVGEYGEPTNGNVHTMSLVDGHLGARPYVFGSGAGPADIGAGHAHPVAAHEDS